jgi:DNA ligase-1
MHWFNPPEHGMEKHSNPTPVAALARRALCIAPALPRRGLLGLAAAGALAALCPRWAAAAGHARRPQAPALLLAQEAPADVHPAGWLVSEKLDGVRALWNGHELISRGGQVLAAPDWYTQALPAGLALDGELWLGRGRFEATSAAVRRLKPHEDEWRALQYHVYELPGAAGTFAQRAAQLRQLAADAASARFSPLRAAPQWQLPDPAALQRRLDEVLQAGGEGLMLHRADAPYVTGRSPLLLKLKPLHDAEALVLAHVPGQGKYAGQLGALRVRTVEGHVLDIGTGFTDAQRAAPPAVGSTITYTHRGFTRNGLPRFASFLRPHAEL